MDKSQKHYWAVFEGKEVVFGGSFNQCWEYLVFNYASNTVSALVASGIRIGRQS